jgi:KDO2-lipid IV(A) lauroyltransferase
MFILYLISDFFYILLFYVFGYRKAVVLKNISYAFPEKSEEEKQKIAKKFYKHFTDIMIESIKAFSISEKEILKRYTYKNPELVNKYAKEGKSIALVSAHLANWEWSISTPLVLNIDVFGAYNKLRNETFEKTLRENREKFGITGATTANFMKLIKHNFENNIQGAYILLSDQSPHIAKTFHWGTFFGVQVPVHTGAEMLAKKNDLVVINYRAKKIKRGYYETDFELITEKPKEYKDYEITDKFLRITEQNITEQPEYYLWSHNRFKHKDKYEEWLKLQETKQQTKS